MTTVTRIDDELVTVRRDDGVEIAIAWHQLRDAAGSDNASDLRSLYAPLLAQARALYAASGAVVTEHTAYSMTLDTDVEWYSAAPGHLRGLPGRPAGQMLSHSARSLDPDELARLRQAKRQQREIAGEIDRAKAVAP